MHQIYNNIKLKFLKQRNIIIIYISNLSVSNTLTVPSYDPLTKNFPLLIISKQETTSLCSYIVETKLQEGFQFFTYAIDLE